MEQYSIDSTLNVEGIGTMLKPRLIDIKKCLLWLSNVMPLGYERIGKER